MLSKQIPLGIYEKALPAGECWMERLQLAKTLGFDFVEMSVDETDVRLARLDWGREQRLALVNAVAETEEEKKIIHERLMAKYLVAGFVTVTTFSVIVAGIFVKFI